MWLVLALALQVEEKKLDKAPALPQVQPGQSLWFEKLEVDGAKSRAALTGPLAARPDKKAHVEVADNFGDGVLVTARDADGRTFATAVIKSKDGLTEFAHARSLGPLVVRDRFQAPKGGDPWAVFAFEETGEKGQEIAEADVKGKKVRRTYAFWVVAREDFHWADYDSDGKICRMGQSQGVAATFDHTKERKKAGPYGLWLKTKTAQQTDGSRLPDSDLKKTMSEALLVTRYDGGTHWRVKLYDKDGRETKTTHFKFSALPFDAAFDKAAAADKQRWKE